MRLVELIQRKSRWTKWMRVFTAFVGIGLAVATLAGCNQTTSVGIGSYPAASGGGEELGIVVDENMKVLEVEPGRAAEKVGVQVGDILDSVEGLSFAKDREQVKALINEPKKDKKLHLKLKRGDKDLLLEMVEFPPPSGADVPTATPVPPSQDYF